jgi:RHS repeat-associated protein
MIIFADQTTKSINYITSPEGLTAIEITANPGEREWYWVFTDHLGSITTLLRESDGQKFEMSFDAWGNRRDPATWVNYTTTFPDIVIDRGFTGHEHLDVFGLINMNGRVYDPVVARFLSPDPYIQAPGMPQNYNGYVYSLNNPLKYTDPSGEFITWSFSNGGFSIGFNLTPIGIPLGAGIKIGWGDGASLGGYSEVGYRVGGTGFGSGVTVSQSLDYNFKDSGWSTTTAEGAYASLGPFNAGINFSQTYDMSSKQWSIGWGVSAGVGIGNDASGIGFNVGYGSGGLIYGIGGYYNSKAWESNPVYAPDEWNDNGEIQKTNNCYSYALDERENGNYWGLQPGEAGGQHITTTADLNLDYVTNAAISDGRIKNPTLLNKLGFGKRGYYSVYLVSADGVDYHWYRQDKGGRWSHKPGIIPVVNVDASGRFISNPVRANHGIYNNGGILLWVKRR